MGKRLLAVLIVLTFAAPASLALVSSARLSPLASPATPLHSNIRAVASEDAFVLRDPVARVLSGIDRVLESLKRQENALAVLLDAEKPEDVREREERISRRRLDAHVVHIA